MSATLGALRLRVASVAAMGMTLAGTLSPPAGAHSGSPAYEYRVGQTLVYEIGYRNFSTTDVSALLGAGSGRTDDSVAQAASFATELTAKLLISVIDVRENSAVVAWRFRDPRLVFRVGEAQLPLEAARMAEGLAREVLVRLELSGRIEGLEFHPATTPLSRGLARALIAATQFVLPPSETPGARWEAMEKDANGSYRARYERLTAEDRRAAGPKMAIEKTRLEYLPVAARAIDRVMPVQRILSSGSMVARFDPVMHRLTGLEGEETQTVEYGGRAIAVSKTSVKLELLRTERLNDPDRSRLAQTLATWTRAARADLSGWTESEAAQELATARRKLGASRWEDLREELTRLTKAEGTPRELREVTGRLEALITVAPGESRHLGKTLLESPAGSTRSIALSSALARVGHSEAQAAMVEVIEQRRNDPETVAYLVPLLAGIREPSPASEQLLRGLAAKESSVEIVDTALLGLGTMAGGLLQRSPARSRENVEFLLNRWRDDLDTRQVYLLILALGNSGSPVALPLLRRYTGSSISVLRRAAIGALRFIEGGEAETLLLEALKADGADEMRLEAASALSYRPMSLSSFRAQAEALEREVDEQVRLAVLGNLWNGRRQFPEAARLIGHAADRDPSSDVRARAGLLLGRK